MAKENTVNLHGQLISPPQLSYDKTGFKKAIIPIKVIRRPFLNSDGAVIGNLRIDMPIVITRNESLIEIIKNCRKGDMIDIQGVLTTRHCMKTSICKCGHKNSISGDIVFITPIYICRREHELSDEEGFALLKERNEISNNVGIIGNVCIDPIVYKDGKSDITQYTIASNRRYHIQDNHEEERTDYPRIKSIGKQAIADAKHLKVNSIVFIRGAIQSRKIQRETVCEECGTKYEWNEVVTEIVPYNTEYLKNCVFDEDIEDIEDENDIEIEE